MLFCANICRCVNVCARECSEWNGSSILIVQIYMQQEKQQQQQHSTEKPKQQQIWPKKTQNQPSRIHMSVCTYMNYISWYIQRPRHNTIKHTITFSKSSSSSFFPTRISTNVFIRSLLCVRSFGRSSSFFCNFLASHQYHVCTDTHTYKYLCLHSRMRWMKCRVFSIFITLKAKYRRKRKKTQTASAAAANKFIETH